MRAVPTLLALLSLTFAALVVAPQEAEAQRNQRIRQGFFFGAGLGVSLLELPGDEERRTRAGGILKVGGSLTPQLLVGVESTIYTEQEPGNTLLFVTLTPTLWFYPLGDVPLHLKAGAGLAVLERDRGFLGGSNNDGGLGLNAGIGWDWHVTESFALTPYANWARGGFNAGDADLIQVGVAFTGF